MIESGTLWLVILGLGFGSYFLRFVFIGFVGDRPLPPWIVRHLRYTAVAILPALVAPRILWPDATGGEPDATRLAAAFVTILVGLWTKNVFAAIFSGAVTLFSLLALGA
ncbi:MAG: AzlD domain-containing protein [Pseudomonadota bacterium]